MKAILVIDMPEDCSECELRGFSNETDDPVCCVNGFLCDYSGSPDWCPLRPLPEKGLTGLTWVDHERYEYILGWNACLEAIKGGEE